MLQETGNTPHTAFWFWHTRNSDAFCSPPINVNHILFQVFGPPKEWPLAQRYPYNRFSPLPICYPLAWDLTSPLTPPPEKFQNTALVVKCKRLPLANESQTKSRDFFLWSCVPCCVFAGDSLSDPSQIPNFGLGAHSPNYPVPPTPQ